MKDFYNILGLSKNASDDEIKKAYRKLSKTYHPDKYSSKSKEEQDKAAEKFKEISEAYEILSNKQKRSNYDNYGNPDGPQFSPNDFFSNFNMGDFFGNMHNGSGFSHNMQFGANVQISIILNLNEIYNGVVKEIKYRKKVRCNTCKGKGGSNIVNCEHCKGTGRIIEQRNQGFMTIQNVKPCSYCNGTGKTIKNKCKDCNGTGFKTIETSLKINIPSGIMNGEILKYPNKGSESKDPNLPNGALNVIIEWDIDVSKYQIINNNVFELIEVPYYDCLLGITINKELPNKEIVNVIVPECSNEGKQIIIPNKGINGRGNYIYVIKVKMPKYLSNNEKVILEQLKKIS